MICIDCNQDGRRINCIFDLKQGGNVCPSCQRVFNPTSPYNSKHFVTKEAAMAAMQKDKARRKHGSNTAAVVDRIIRPID
jgi:hypothetical protein